MSGAALLAILALGLASTRADQDPGTVEALLAERRYVEALAAIDTLEAPRRQRLRVRALHGAGDLLGALDAVRRGLAEFPDDKELLLGGADVALALDAPVAFELTRRLEAAVAALPTEAENRAWWEERAGTYRAFAEEQQAARASRRAAERRARWIAGGGLSAAALALVVLARRRAQA